MLNERVAKLKENLISSKPKIYLERALLATESYKTSEGLSMEIRKAKMLEHILDNITINIREGELIVGNKTEGVRCSPLYPEIDCGWLEQEMDTISTRSESPFYLDDDSKQILAEQIIPYWKGKNIHDYLVPNIPQDVELAGEQGFFYHYYLNRSIGHITVDYEKVLRIGFNGIAAQIQTELAGIDFNNPDSLKKKVVLEGMLISCQAAVRFGLRYSQKAQELAQKESDMSRKQELERIAEICSHVPGNAARNFYEALQSFYFVQLILNLETNSYAISPGRFDQYLYPFFQADLENGMITREQALELIECLWIKLDEFTVVKESGTAKASNTYVDFQNLNLGGLRPDGLDGTNELSYLCLEATGELRLPQPQVTVLISNLTPKEFLIKTSEVIRMGFGIPAVVNDDAKVLALLDKGRSIEEARGGSINGCVELNIPGKDFMASSGYINLAKCLELVLAKHSQFTSFDQFYAAYCEELEDIVDLKVKYDNIAKQAYALYFPVPFTSMLLDDCILKGRDYHDGGTRYSLPMACGVGTGTVTDSLYLIKKYIFEDTTLTLSDLVAALNANFAGYDDIYSLTQNSLKYGNGEEAVDELARRLVNSFNEILKKKHSYLGVPYAANMIPTSTHIPLGAQVGATPDGRKAFTPLSEGISPVQGTDKNGPTMCAISVAKIDVSKCAGTLFNMKFHPSALSGNDGLSKFASFIRAYFDLGGYHIQFNVVSSETLREAQIHPEEYKSLLVRVAGYSDYFVTLSPELQNEIISRTAHAVV